MSETLEPDTPEEVWKEVEGYPMYVISNWGNLRNVILNTSKKIFVYRSEYRYVQLSNSDGPKKFYVHRLVAQHFLSNPDSKKEVNHLGAKSQNQAWMLEWTTRQENMQHAHKNVIKYRKVAIRGIDIFTGEIKLYDTPKDVARDGFSTAAVLNCLRGKSSTSGKHQWEYVEEKAILVDLEDEQWVALGDSSYSEVKSFTRYRVSNMGRVKNQHNRLVNNRMCGSMLTVKLMNGKITKRISVHRLVIMAFNVPNPEDKPQVDHIDSDYSNNRLDNLRWVTCKENMANPATIEKRMKKLVI